MSDEDAGKKNERGKGRLGPTNRELPAAGNEDVERAQQENAGKRTGAWEREGILRTFKSKAKTWGQAIRVGLNKRSI